MNILDLTKTADLKTRLEADFLSKTSLGVIPGIALLVFSWFMFPQIILSGIVWPGLGILSVLILSLRSILFIKITKDNFKKIVLLNYLISIINSICLGLITAFFIYYNGVTSIPGTIFSIQLCIYCIATTYVTANNLFIQRIYLTIAFLPLGILSIISYFTEGKNGIYDAYFLIMYFYLILFGKTLHQQLVNLLISESKVRALVNAIPGFVVTFNNNKEIDEKSLSFTEIKNSQVVIDEYENFILSNALKNTKEIEIDNHSYTVSFQRQSNKAKNIVIAGIETTDLKNTRKELELQRSKSEYSARLATLGEMASGVAHEINNPMTIISSYNNKLLKELQVGMTVTEQTIEKLNKSKNMISRVVKIIHSMKAFSRSSDDMPFRNEPLIEMVDDVIELCSSRAKILGCQIEIQNLPPNDLKIKSRGVQIGQVLMNLINNSLHAIANNENKSVQISFEINQETIEISVKDYGPGIPENLKLKIFEPFFTTKDPGEGTGLGLSVSKSFMLDHGGDLYLKNNYQPTEFIITIPNKKI